MITTLYLTDSTAFEESNKQQRNYSLTWIKSLPCFFELVLLKG